MESESNGYITLYNERIINASVITAPEIDCETLRADEILEHTTDNGVDVEGVLLKDGLIQDSAYTTGVLHSDANGAITSSTIVNADVSASAGITYSKLNLSNSIVNADINTSAGIVDTKLATISTSGKVSNSATTATSSNTANAIVSRDASGNFSAGTITANEVDGTTNLLLKSASGYVELLAGTNETILQTTSTTINNQNIDAPLNVQGQTNDNVLYVGTTKGTLAFSSSIYIINNWGLSGGVYSYSLTILGSTYDFGSLANALLSFPLGSFIRITGNNNANFNTTWTVTNVTYGYRYTPTSTEVYFESANNYTLAINGTVYNQPNYVPNKQCVGIACIPNSQVGDSDGFYTLDIAGTARIQGTSYYNPPYTSEGAILSVDSGTITDTGTLKNGTLSDWIGVYVNAPTLASYNDNVTTTDAYTLYIAGPPTAGTNETITNPYSLYVASGTSYLYNLVTSGITFPSFTTGILHSNGSGVISSSNIVNADVDASAGIEVSKLLFNGSVNPSVTNTYYLGSPIKKWAYIYATNIDVYSMYVSYLYTDIINESTLNNGVIIDGVTLKDGLINDTAYSTGILHSDVNGAITSSTIVNADVNASAGITYSKLSLANSIVNADINTSAGIVDTKLATISTPGKVSNSATTATVSSTANAIVTRDAGGSFVANVVTASLNGTALNATNVNLTNDVASATRYLHFSSTATGYQTTSTNTSIVCNPSSNTIGNGSTTFSGNATNATNVNLSNDTTNATRYLHFSSTATGNQPTSTNTAIVCNPSTNTIGNGSTTFSGNATTATTATNVTLATTTDTTCSIVLAQNQDGNAQQLRYDTGVTYNASTDTFTATNITGDFNGTINTLTTGTTQSQGNNSTKIATTAYVDRAVSTTNSSIAYAFMTCSTAQTITTGTATVVSWTTGSTTSANCTVTQSAPNWNVQNTSGSTQIWLITYTFEATNTSSTTTGMVGYFCNYTSQTVAQNQYARAGTTFGMAQGGVTGSQIVSVPANNYITFGIWHNFGSNITLNGGGASQTGYISIRQLI